MNRATMVNWMHRCGELLEPIVDILKERIIESGYARADETPSKVIFVDGENKKGLSYFWLFMTGEQHNPYIVFEYHPTRSGEIASEFFKDFNGFLQCDGYSGYNALRLKSSVTVVGCFTHVRRSTPRSAYKLGGVSPPPKAGSKHRVSSLELMEATT
jgi:transposase